MYTFVKITYYIYYPENLIDKKNVFNIQNESEVAFGVMISPSRKYIVRVEAENRKTVLIGFFITNQRPTCNTSKSI